MRENFIKMSFIQELIVLHAKGFCISVSEIENVTNCKILLEKVQLAKFFNFELNQKYAIDIINKLLTDEVMLLSNKAYTANFQEETGLLFLAYELLLYDTTK